MREPTAGLCERHRWGKGENIWEKAVVLVQSFRVGFVMFRGKEPVNQCQILSWMSS